MMPPQFVSLLILLLQRIEQFSEQDQTKAMVSYIRSIGILADSFITTD